MKLQNAGNEEKSVQVSKDRFHVEIKHQNELYFLTATLKARTQQRSAFQGHRRKTVSQ